MVDWIIHLVDQHGYIILFASLMLELIALPIPTEILMSYSGFLAYQGNLNLFINILMAGLGSSTGMTISYWIGFKLGRPFFNKYGHYIHMGPERLEKVSNWYTKYGNKILIFAFFIPGVRHITGYFSGITRIPFRIYSIFAYFGAFLWVSTFILIGRLLGPNWDQFHVYVKKYLYIFIIVIVALLILAYLYKSYKNNLKDFLLKMLNQSIKTFHTLRRARLLILVISFVFFGLVALMIGMIQDYLSNEFTLFNQITGLIIDTIFQGEWTKIMNGISQLSSIHIIIPIIAATLIWIFVKGKNKGLELVFLFLAVFGGQIIEQILRYLFHKIGPLSKLPSIIAIDFPGDKAFLAIVVYGISTYLILRHVEHRWVKIFIPIVSLFFVLTIGVSQIYLKVQLPSDVVAGFVFGGVWLSFNVFLLEIFRLFSDIKYNQI